MNQKDFKTRMAHEALIILGVLALLSVICRLWPILLLLILGIFIAALRLLFLSAKKEPTFLLPYPDRRRRQNRPSGIYKIWRIASY